jgi:hypothetical protein
MTLPDERYRAIRQAAEFLLALTDPRSTPRVPRTIRQHARSLLRHYPTEYHLHRLAERSPDVIIERMEPLTKMVMIYEQEKNRDDAS